MEIGLRNSRSRWVPLHAKRATTLLVGKQGTGKSETLRRLAIKDIRDGKPIVYFGDRSILNYLPSSKNTVLVAPDLFPFPFNVLKSKPSLVLQAIKSLWPSDVATVRIDSYVGAGLLTLQGVPRATLFTIIDLLANEGYKNIPLTDTALIEFWERFDAMSPKERRDKTESSLSRLQSFMFEPAVRACLSDTRNNLVFKDMSVIVSLSPSELGGENARLLGALILAHLASENPRTTLYLDGYVPGISIVLERCPSLPVFLAVQSLTQLGKERDAVMASVKQTVAFRTSKRDADELEPEFDLGTLDHLNTQPDYHAFFNSGFSSTPLYMPLHEYKETRQAERIINHSRKVYG